MRIDVVFPDFVNEKPYGMDINDKMLPFAFALKCNFN